METPPSHRHSHLPSRAQLDFELARDDLLSKLGNKGYFKKDLLAQVKPSERDAQRKTMDDLRKQLRFLGDTKWMF